MAGNDTKALHEAVIALAREAAAKILEAAKVDGARGWKAMRSATCSPPG